MKLSAKGNHPHVVDEGFVVYDWSQFLTTYMKALPNILSYHQIKITHNAVSAIKHLEDEQQYVYKLLKSEVPAVGAMPPQIPLKGLDPSRQWYLYESIRDFCRHGTEDLVAPHPTVAKPGKKQQYIFHRTPFHLQVVIPCYETFTQ